MGDVSLATSHLSGSRSLGSLTFPGAAPPLARPAPCSPRPAPCSGSSPCPLPPASPTEAELTHLVLVLQGLFAD